MGASPVLFAVAVLALAAPGRAQDPPSRFQVGAFGTLGVAGTDSHQAQYPRTVTQPTGAVDQPTLKEDTRFGLQLAYTFSDTLKATLQGVSQYRYDGTFRPDITWAALTWNPVSNLQVRAGRMTLEPFEGGVSANVGYTYLWVRPSVEVFSTQVVPVTDGIDLKQSFPLGSESLLSLEAWGGREVGKAPIWNVSQPMDFTGGRSMGMTVGLQHGPWKYRFSLFQAGIPREYPPPISEIGPILSYLAQAPYDPRLAQTAALFSVSGARERGYSTGVLYGDGPLRGEGFLVRSYSDRYLLPATRSGYLSLGCQVGKVTPYLMYARALSERRPLPYLGYIPQSTDPDLQSLTAALGLLTTVADQHTWSAGCRWDFAEHADLKLQVDLVHSPTALPLMYNLTPAFDGHLAVMSVVLDFVFGGGRK
jgi:hypothetical protein